MSAALFFTNACKFNNCGVHFASLWDLVQHIEETHIPIIESEQQKREEQEKSQDPQQAASQQQNQTQTVPLSSIYRLFPVLPQQKAKPIKPDTSGCSLERDDEVSNESFREEFDEFAGDASFGSDGLVEERKYKCPVSGCNKRYKNLQGVRYHAKMAHSATGGDSEQPAPPTRPYKCSQCPKRYKTPGGLQNHVQQTHRQGGGSGGGANSLVPVSPSAVTNADRQAAQSTTTSLVPQSPAITATTLIGQSSGTPASTRPSASSQQQIQTAPPPVAGGHQYHQLTPPGTPTVYASGVASSSSTMSGQQGAQPARMTTAQRSSGGGLSFTVPIMPNDGSAKGQKRMSGAAMTASRQYGYPAGRAPKTAPAHHHQQHLIMAAGVPQQVVSASVPQDPIHPVTEVVVSGTGHQTSSS
uniref:C2H2-type domain-containing protein n=1 Tax=Plectus sambesii TaxID=2011161 RepID=A0A914W279_9BILA